MGKNRKTRREDSSDSHGLSPAARSSKLSWPREGRKPGQQAFALARRSRDLGTEQQSQQGKQCEQQLSQRRGWGKDTAQGFCCSCPLSDGWCFRQRKGVTEPVVTWTSKICFLLPLVQDQVEKHIICKLRNTAELLLPSVTDSQFGCMAGNPIEVQGHHYGKGKTNPTLKQQAALLSAIEVKCGRSQR